MNITIQQIEDAAEKMRGVVEKTPLQFSKRLSKKYDANVYIKREDLQEVRSFKIRGAYNKTSSLTQEEKKLGVVTASTGNHAQGVGLSCRLLKVHGVIFMPTITPHQKIEKVRHFGDGYTQIKLVGNTFDDALIASRTYAKDTKAIYVHPFDDEQTIAGQATIGKEIHDELGYNVDYVFAGVGGGSLTSGISIYMKNKNPKVKIYGVEANGAAGMYQSLKQNKVITLEKIDTFVDGAAVKTVGNITFAYCKKYLEKVLVVSEGRICTIMIDLYQNEGIVAEPAGVLGIAALDDVMDEVKGKTIVCVLSGGNNDLLRYPEVIEQSLVYKGLKHYFLIEFAQKPGQLKKFLDKAMGPTDDIVRFEYMKKTNKERGAALVGVELKDKKDFDILTAKMKEIELNFRILSTDDLLYSYLV